MAANFESQWDGDWFRAKAAHCHRLAKLCPTQEVSEQLLVMAREFETEANRADSLAAAVRSIPPRPL